MAFSLERHTGRRRPREHDGQVATIRSNCRWCSDALEFTCWNGEVVRVAFALDCHDREAISWIATTAGISGTPIPDAATALALIDNWMEDYNSVHPHSRLGYRSPGTIAVYAFDVQDNSVGKQRLFSDMMLDGIK